MYFKKIFYPEFFQGEKKKTDYFEGWYFKLVNKERNISVAVIPGISLNKTDSHSFIQLFLSKTVDNEVYLKRRYFRYDIKDFAYDSKEFSVSVKDNFFSKNKMKLNLIDEDITVKSDIDAFNLIGIKKSVFMPNIMGFFGYMNFMECYHGIVSMTHSLSGFININDDVVSFNNGKGYIEKDWGKSFPRKYVWLQSNHFSDDSASFLFSYALIPFGIFNFNGLIINLLIDKKEYRFATYNNAKILYEEIKKGYVKYEIKKSSYRLTVEAFSDKEIDLPSPRNGAMIESIKEGLSGKIKVTLFKKNIKIFEDTGYNAGIEIMKPYKNS